MERSWATAAQLAKRLQAHPNAARVFSAPRCALVSLEVEHGLEGAERAVSAFKMLTLTPSLGGIVTTVSHSASSSNRSQSVEERAKLGVTDGLLRVSVGLEDVEDIWRDLDAGLRAAAGIR